jgi:hypothetical protein
VHQIHVSLVGIVKMLKGSEVVFSVEELIDEMIVLEVR